MDMELSIRGILTANFELTIDEADFADACESVELDPEKFKKFTFAQWQKLRDALIDTTCNMESEIDYVEIHDANTVSVDEIHIDDTDNMTIVTYQHDGKVDSVDIQ